LRCHEIDQRDSATGAESSLLTSSIGHKLHQL
jgi:hypothetical protein